VKQPDPSLKIPNTTHHISHIDAAQKATTRQSPTLGVELEAHRFGTTKD
jgi:hypothetical protein